MAPLAPWRSILVHALHQNQARTNAYYLQLATVNLDQRPANRTVVFRGFLDDSDQLKFVTDCRSEKIKQIQQSPWAEACWYFPLTREQFRIAGQLTLIDAQSKQLQHQRQLSWQALSDSAREQFTWPSPGKSTAETPSSMTVDTALPNPTFGLLLLEPDRVDHLELQECPHQRCLYLREPAGHWTMQPVNP